MSQNGITFTSVGCYLLIIAINRLFLFCTVLNKEYSKRYINAICNKNDVGFGKLLQFESSPMSKEWLKSEPEISCNISP